MTSLVPSLHSQLFFSFYYMLGVETGTRLCVAALSMGLMYLGSDVCSEVYQMEDARTALVVR